MFPNIGPTTLDLDREKEGGGWGRIQYVRNQLVALYGDNSPMLAFTDDQQALRNLSEPEFNLLAQKNNRTEVPAMKAWVQIFQDQFDVFFCSPLDLDFSMLRCFPEAYENQAPSGAGPRLPATEPERSEAIRSRMRQVLASDAVNAPPELGSSYSALQVRLFPWYKYLFVDGSKPVAHMRALVALETTNWVRSIPRVLKLLIERARQLVRSDVTPVT